MEQGKKPQGVLDEDQEAMQPENQQRLQLLKSIRPYVSNLVYRAFEEVDRKLFTPPSFVKDAYQDVVIPLGYQGSTMSQPTLVVEMTNLLMLTGKENVLELGTGSGYSAAILAKCALRVTTIEINPFLADKAREKLNDLGIANVSVYSGDGRLGFESNAPYDAIVITAASKRVPKALLKQLTVGGVMVAPVGSETNQVLKRFTKLHEGVTNVEVFSQVRFVPLVNSTQSSLNP